MDVVRRRIGSRLMSIIQAIIASAASSPPPPPPPYSGNNWVLLSDDPNRGFASIDNWWQSSTTGGGAYSYSILSSPPPAWNSYTYPNSSNGHVYEFTGIEHLISPNLSLVPGTWPDTQITIDFWFYPTNVGVQLLSEIGEQSAAPGWHSTVLEIDNSGHVRAGFWNGMNVGGPAVSTNTVTLNQWNHVYFASIWTGDYYFELNGTATNGNPNYVRVKPSAEHFIIGYADITNMGSTSKFTGKVGALTISDYVAPSTFSSTRTKFGL